jgi:deoxyribodipyrimidine photo-lyase
LDRSVEPVGGFPPGTENGMERMRSFFERIKNYSNRNKIDQKAQSDLSPYLHFGQISAQRVIMEAISLKKNRSALAEAVDEFVEGFRLFILIFFLCVS